LSARGGRDLAASVRQRLLNRARERGEDFQLVLTWYGIERLLYRLSQSPHSDDFVLKGAMLFSLWSGESHRPTRDLDLLGFGDAGVERVEAVLRVVCKVQCEDGMEFDADSVRGEEIRSPDEYEGVRIKLVTRLAAARVPLQVDVGFGDAVVPPPEPIEYPSLLDLPSPRLRAYPREVFVAEKLQALVELGIANTRMKDFYDLWMLARRFDFEGERLGQAIAATFERRRTPIPRETPLALTSEFHGDAAKRTQWRAFLRKGSVSEAGELPAVAELIGAFVMPPAGAARAGRSFGRRWPKSGPWTHESG
jgi:predicted nucleotidyltransferase component of viral defense system